MVAGGSNATGLFSSLIPKNDKNSSARTEGIPEPPNIEKTRMKTQPQLTASGCPSISSSYGISVAE